MGGCSPVPTPSPARRDADRFGLLHSSDPSKSDEAQQLCGNHVRSPHAVRSLALQNTQLRHKLRRARTQSRERVSQMERDNTQLSTENTLLRRECESLRQLFIRQQQQQIAFWTGPFMEMMGPQAIPDGMSALGLGIGKRVESDNTEMAKQTTSTRQPVAVGSRNAPSETEVEAEPEVSPPSTEGAQHVAQAHTIDLTMMTTVMEPSRDLQGIEELLPLPPTNHDDASKEDSYRTLLKERDYWRAVASELTREMENGLQLSQSFKESPQQGHASDELSTSQQGSEFSRTPWSESGSDLSAASFVVDA